MHFRIIGAHGETGEDVKMVIAAPDHAAAVEWASKNGILWTSIAAHSPSQSGISTSTTAEDGGHTPLEAKSPAMARDHAEDRESERRIAREDMAARAEQESSIESKSRIAPGIRGWLILAAIGFVLGIFMALGELEIIRGIPQKVIQNSPAIRLMGEQPQQLAQEVGRRLNIVVGIISVKLIGKLFVAQAFYRRKRYFPRLYVGFVVGFLAIDLMTQGFLDRIIQWSSPPVQAVVRQHRDPLAPIRTIFVGGIWSLYFFTSKRVEVTFVR